MKRIGIYSLLLTWLLVFTLTPSIQADNPQPSARGKVKLSLTDGAAWQIEFEASLHRDGRTTGEITFIGQTKKADSDNRGEGVSSTTDKSWTEFYFKAAFDCMVIKGTRAVMAGTITQSNSEKYVGRRVVLVIQDTEKDVSSLSADKLTWGIYNPVRRTWLASDGELAEDQGVGATWLATDAERDDDPGVSSDKTDSIGCQTFPLSSFSLIKIKKGDGDIEVLP